MTCLYSLLALCMLYVLATPTQIAAVVLPLSAKVRALGERLRLFLDKVHAVRREQEARGDVRLAGEERRIHLERHREVYTVAAVVVGTIMALSVAAAIGVGVALARVYGEVGW